MPSFFRHSVTPGTPDIPTLEREKVNQRKPTKVNGLESVSDIWHFDIVACQWEDGKANAVKRVTDCPDNGQSLESLLNKATEESYCPNS